jgi:predicted metal-binding membrane protein
MMADMAIPANPFERGVSRAFAACTGPDRAFLSVAGLVFLASAAVTVLWCGSMSAMAEIPMSGGWTMSMAWMPMCGQTWLSAATSFVGMWVVMMVAMMLPSLIPILWQHRRAAGRIGNRRLGLLTGLVGAGYFIVWTGLGIAIFPLGARLATIAMEEEAVARAMPLAAGAVVLLAGAVQFSAWKIHQLAWRRETPGRCNVEPVDAAAALRHGLRLGIHCSISCGNLTAILLVLGVMDLRAMTAVTLAITAERLLPASKAVARGIGSVIIVASLLLIAQALGFGWRLVHAFE